MVSVATLTLIRGCVKMVSVLELENFIDGQLVASPDKQAGKQAAEEEHITHPPSIYIPRFLGICAF